MEGLFSFPISLHSPHLLILIFFRFSYLFGFFPCYFLQPREFYIKGRIIYLADGGGDV